MNKIFISYLSLFVGIGMSCNNLTLSSERTMPHLFEYDTIHPAFTIVDRQCQKEANGYYSRFGIVISNFYEVLSYDVSDLNGDSVGDTIAVLAPLNMVIPSENEACKSEKKANRILFVSMGDIQGFYRFDNVITNEFGFATTGSEIIEPTKHGFYLEKHLGQGCFFDSKIKINYKEKVFYIDSIYLTSGCHNDIKKKIKTFNKYDFNLKDYRRNLIDSLKLIYGL